jgi:phosphoribosylaminoimidazole carboxylase PurE protein
VTSGEKQVKARVGILMGSDTDLPVMSEAGKALEKFGIAYEMEVVSAHRTPARAHEYATSAVGRGIKVLIVGAGAAAHLAGVIAANTTLPVIGVPLATSALNGLDALLATVQMPEIARRLVAHKEDLVRGVAEKNARLQEQLGQKK